MSFLASDRMVRPHRRTPAASEKKPPRGSHPFRPVSAINAFIDALAGWCRHHARAQLRSISYIRREAGQFVPACIGLGLILSLPLFLYVAALNVHHLGGYWRLGSGVSAYLKPHGEESAELALVERLRVMPEIGEVVYHSRSEALEEFRNWSGLSAVLDGLSSNPLPAALEVYHSAANPTREDIELLRLTLDALPDISVARADLNWLAEYHHLGALLWRVLLVAALVVLSGVVFAIAFSVRMMIMSRREEIRVTKLMGAGLAYVARPFVYLGSCYGALGTLTACVLVSMCGLWLDQPIAHLVAMYDGDFRLRGLGFFPSLLLILSGAALGALGAWVGVRTQLANFDQPPKN